MLQMKRLQRVGLILAVILVVDHATKFIAVAALKGGPAIKVLGDYFQLIYAENVGAFLSLGANLPEAARGYILTGLNIVILASVFGFLAFRRYIPLPTIYALALLLAGGVGNIIDRITRGGRVVDFMHVDTGLHIGRISLQTGIFNIADLAIMGGLFLLLGYEMLGTKNVPALEDVSEIEAAKPRQRTD